MIKQISFTLGFALLFSTLSVVTVEAQRTPLTTPTTELVSQAKESESSLSTFGSSYRYRAIRKRLAQQRARQKRLQQLRRQRILRLQRIRQQRIRAARLAAIRRQRLLQQRRIYFKRKAAIQRRARQIVRRRVKTNIVRPVKGNFESLIRKYCKTYGCNSKQLIRVMYCESSGRSNARNGIYSGLFQFHPRTFSYYSKKAGLRKGNIWNPYHQIQVATWMFANGQARQWECK